MKLTDWLRKIAEQGQIIDTDFNALLSASGLAEFEVPDEVATKFDNAFLTRDRAENDPEIIKRIKNTSKAEVLDGVDEQLKALSEILPKDKAEEINKNRNTFERITALGKALKDITEGTKTKVEKDIQKVEEEWSQKLKAEKSQYEEKLKDFARQNKDIALNSILKGKIFAHEFAEPFKALKEDLAEIVIKKVKSSAPGGTPVVLDLDENGNLNVRHEVEGTLRDIYNGQKKVVLDDLLNPALDPYIKKSNGNGQGTNPDSNGEGKKVTPPVDARTMTLHDQMRAKMV